MSEIVDAIACELSPTYFAINKLDTIPLKYQVDLLEDQDDRIIVVWGRQLGKTFTLALKALHFCLTNKNKNVIILAPFQIQARVMYDQIRKLCKDNGIELATDTQKELKFPNGSSITNIPVGDKKGANVRSQHADLLLMDEVAFMLHDKEVWQAVQPLIVSTDGAVIMISTPYGRNGLFYDKFLLAEAGDEWKLYHMATDEGTKYIRADTGKPHISARVLREARNEMLESQYLTEYGAQFLDAELSFFPPQLVDACQDNDIDLVVSLMEPIGDVVFGFDWGDKVNSTVISAIMIVKIKGQDESSMEDEYMYYLIGQWEFKPENFENKQVDNDEVIEYFANNILPNFGKVSGCYAEATGLGIPIVQRLDKICSKKGVPVYPVNMSPTGRNRMYNRMKLIMQGDRWRHPACADFRKQMLDIREEKLPVAKMSRFSVPSGHHDDRVDSVVIALECTDFNVGSPSVDSVKSIAEKQKSKSDEPLKQSVSIAKIQRRHGGRRRFSPPKGRSGGRRWGLCAHGQINLYRCHI